jgi:uncharacterized protein YjiS (DUF1127 family)
VERVEEPMVREWRQAALGVVQSSDRAPFALGQAARIVALADSWLEQRRIILALLETPDEDVP